MLVLNHSYISYKNKKFDLFFERAVFHSALCGNGVQLIGL